jgi:hypothetical protein
MVVMMIRTKEAIDTTKLYTQNQIIQAVFDSAKFLSSQITIMTMSSGKRIQISQGKLTKQILNVVLTTEAF